MPASVPVRPSPQIATLWKLAAAVFEAQAHGLLGFDVFSKRVASRLLAQYRIVARGDANVSERLAQDLLFFCAQSASPGDGRHSPRLAAVRLAYGLAHHLPIDYALSVLGRFDPAMIAQARKRVVAAKDAWSAVAGGEMHRMTGLSEQFALVGESLKRLFPLGDIFAAELQQSVAQTQQSDVAPPPPLAMEVATSLLYVEAALDDIDFDHPEQAARVQRLADRQAAVRQGRAPDPLEGWMEDLYRRVSDRQTMGSVVQELRASLSEAEKLIDQHFRQPEDRKLLIPVPNQLAAMRGVLSVLGMDHASAALLRMRDEIDGLVASEPGAERRHADRPVRSARRQPGRARLPDRHAQRAAAAGEDAVPLRRRVRHAEPGDGPGRGARAGGRARHDAGTGRAAPDRAGPDARIHLGARRRSAGRGRARSGAPVARGAGRRSAGTGGHGAEGAAGAGAGRRRGRRSPGARRAVGGAGRLRRDRVRPGRARS